MFTLEYAKEPAFISEDNQQILMTVKWAEFNEEFPFNATSYDCEAHGVDLYNRAVAGEFGIIAEYVAPSTEQPASQGTQTI
jgi:hypothetical protein